jgi:hypothetical protein
MVSGRSGLWVGLLALGTQACGPHELGIASAIDEGRANELSATAKHDDEWIRMRGVVTQTGLKRVNQVVIGLGKAQARVISTDNLGYPYLYAEDAARGAAGGRLLCFFVPDDMARVGKVKAGEQVVVTGQFQQYSEGAATIVLHHCELE